MMRGLLGSLLFAVSACGPELVTDIAWACIVPADVECSTEVWSGTIDSYGACKGVYPTDRPYQVEVQLPSREAS
jgi:hypothetical protein